MTLKTKKMKPRRSSSRSNRLMIFLLILKRKDSMIWVVLMSMEMLISLVSLKALEVWVEWVIFSLVMEDRVAEDILDSLSNKVGKDSKAWEI
jgi:hypothetical protein